MHAQSRNRKRRPTSVEAVVADWRDAAAASQATPAPGTVTVRAWLDSVGLLPTVQYLGALGASGTLYVDGDRGSGTLGFDHGCLVDAVYGDVRGWAAVEELVLGIRTGTFVYAKDAVPTGDLVMCAPDELAERLAELATRYAAVRSAIPTLAAVPHLGLTPPPAQPTPAIAPDWEPLRMLLEIDGQRSVADLIGNGPAALVLWQLAQLVEADLIRLEPPAVAKPAAGAGAAASAWWRPRVPPVAEWHRPRLALTPGPRTTFGLLAANGVLLAVNGFGWAALGTEGAALLLLGWLLSAQRRAQGGRRGGRAA